MRIDSGTLYTRNYYKDQAPVSLASARIVVPCVIDFVRPTSVVDVGCGVGAWLSVFQEYGVRRIVGLDGAYVDRSLLMIPHDACFNVDLRSPFCLDETFDLALSLEVAEHLPPRSA